MYVQLTTTIDVGVHSALVVRSAPVVRSLRTAVRLILVAVWRSLQLPAAPGASRAREPGFDHTGLRMLHKIVERPAKFSAS